MRTTQRTFIDRRLMVVLIAGLVTCLSASAFAQELTPEQLLELRTKVDATLTSEQSEVRRLAVLSLGAMVDKKGLKDFRKYAQDADPVVKNGALVALARRGDKAGLKAMKATIEETNLLDLQKLLAELLQPLDEKTQSQMVKDLLKKPKTEELRQGVYTWVARDGSDALYANLAGVSKVKDAEARNQLAGILAMFPREAALPIAKDLMKSKDVGTRTAALKLARAIAQVAGQNHDSTQVIAKALNDADDTVKQAAEKHLLELKHPAVVPILEARVKENPKDTASIAVLLELEGSKDLLDVLIPLVEKDNPTLEQPIYNQILSLVASSKSDRAKELIRNKLSGTFEKDRIAATHAIGYTGDKAFSANLQVLAFDGSLEIRRAAAVSFGLLGDPASLDIMNKALGKETDAQAKLSIVKSMGDIGDAAAVNHLQFLMTNRDADLKHATLDALVKLKAQSATAAIELVAEDADASLRWHAIVSLFLIDSTVYGERLKKAVADAPDDAFFATLESLPTEMRDKLEEEVLRSTRSALALRLVQEWAGQGRTQIAKLRRAYDLNKDMDVRTPVLDALSRYADADDFDRFKGEIANTDRAVRLMALRTLLRYPKDKTRDIFMEQTNSDDPLFQVLGIYGIVQ